MEIPELEADGADVGAVLTGMGEGLATVGAVDADDDDVLDEDEG